MNNTKQFLLLILMFQLIASGTHIVAKSITYEISPSLLMFLRASVSGIVYLLWMAFNRSKIIKIEKKDWYKVILLGLLNIPLNQYLFLIAVKMTSAPNVSLAYALTPAFVLLLAISFFNEKTTVKKIIGVFIALSGTVFIIMEKGIEFSSDNFWGFLIVLSASLFYALYTIIGREFSMKYGPIYSMGITMLSGFVLYLPIFFLVGGELAFSTLSATNWLQVLYLGVITSGFAYGLWYVILTKTEASKAAVFNNLQPVFTTILSLVIFAHEITIPFILGGLLIVSGVYLTQKG